MDEAAAAPATEATDATEVDGGSLNNSVDASPDQPEDQQSPPGARLDQAESDREGKPEG